MAKKDEKQPVSENRGGRPTKKRPEETGTALLYKTALRLLRDLANWRRDRFKHRDYSVADCFKEIFEPVLKDEWEAENERLRRGKAWYDYDREGTWLKPYEVGSPGKSYLPIAIHVSNGSITTEDDMSGDEIFDFRTAFCQLDSYMVQVDDESMIKDGILKGDLLIVSLRQSIYNSGDLVAVVVKGKILIGNLERRSGPAPGAFLTSSSKAWRGTYQVDWAGGDRYLGHLIGIVRKTAPPTIHSRKVLYPNQEQMASTADHDGEQG